jgi:putative addiction module component (TIGR02574 family)
MVSELQLDQMTVEQKSQLVDDLWLPMAPELESLEVSPKDQELLDRRWVAFLRDPSVALTLEEFQQRMKAIRA